MPFDRKTLAVALGLLGLTLAAYFPVFHADFVNFDDKEYVTENLAVQAGWTWDGVKWAFTTSHMGSWHPLTWLSHMTDVEMFGGAAAGHHATSLALHLANVLLLFGLVRKWTKEFWYSAVVAALFAVHPLHVESVAWVAERKDVLSTFFGLLSLLGYTHYTQSSESVAASGSGPLKSPAYWFAGVTLGFGLLSKPMLVTWPFLLLLLDVWPLQRTARYSCGRLLKEKLPFFVMVVAVAVLTWQTQKHSEAVMSLQELSLTSRLLNTLHSIATYVGQFFWPIGLSPFYPLADWGVARLLVAGVVVLGITGIAVWQRSQRPWLLAGWLWYLLILFPVCGLTQAGLQAHADRYTYLPSIGWGLALVFGLAPLVVCHVSSMVGRALLVLVPILALSGLTFVQAGYWQGSEPLFRHALAVTDRNFMAHQGLGEELVRVGKDSEAKPHFQAALDIYPRLPSARNNLAVILLREGDFTTAIREFQRVLAERPDLQTAHFNRAQAYEGLGQFAAAAEDYRQFLMVQPDDLEARFNLARCLGRCGQPAEAIAQLQSLRDLSPEDLRVILLLAEQYQAARRYDAAVREYESAIGLNPRAADICNNLAWLLAACPDSTIRNGARAIELARHACALTENRQPFFLGTLAAAYAEAGRFEEAIATAQQAIDLATAEGRPELAARNRQLQELYRVHQPYHEPAASINSVPSPPASN